MKLHNSHKITTCLHSTKTCSVVKLISSSNVIWCEGYINFEVTKECPPILNVFVICVMWVVFFLLKSILVVFVLKIGQNIDLERIFTFLNASSSPPTWWTRWYPRGIQKLVSTYNFPDSGPTQGGRGGTWSQNWKYSKCQDMPEFQFSGGGGSLVWNSREGLSGEFGHKFTVWG